MFAPNMIEAYTINALYGMQNDYEIMAQLVEEFQYAGTEDEGSIMSRTDDDGATGSGLRRRSTLSPRFAIRSRSRDDGRHPDRG